MSFLVEAIKRRKREVRGRRPDLLCVDSQTLNPVICDSTCHNPSDVLIESDVSLLRAICVAHGTELLAMGVPKIPTVVVGHAIPSPCPWLLPDGCCALQELAKRHGDDDWAYEPLACVLRPLKLHTDGGLSRIVINSSDLAGDSNTSRKQVEFVKKLWGYDVLASAANPPPSISGFRPSGLRAVTKNNAVWVGEFKGQTVALKASLRADGVVRLSNEERHLRALDGGHFPRVVKGCGANDAKPALMTEFFSDTLPMPVWLKTKPTAEIIAEVSKDLLRACCRLEERRIMHHDLCPQNILVNPDTGRIRLVDFELAQSGDIKSRCRGGSIGFAAPEQYLNFLGTCRYATESFVVGAVLFHAFHPEFFGSGVPFPYAAAQVDRMPRECYAAMWALLGDPLQMFLPRTRASAEYVLKEWSRLPLKLLPNRSVELAEARAPKSFGPWDGISIAVQPRGLEVCRMGVTVSTYRGLIDMGSISIRIEDGEIRLGAASIDRRNGDMQLKLVEEPVVSVPIR